MVAALGLGAQAWLGARFVYWVQDVYPELLVALGVLAKGSLAERALAALSAALYRHATRVIALDEAMADRLVAAGAQRARVRVIDHFCDTQELTPQTPAENALRKRLGLTDEFIVCYAGNHGHCHDFDTLIAALAQQAEAGDLTIHWLFVGDGEQRQHLVRSVPSALRRNVHLLPPQARAELPAVLSAGSVGLVTLKPELYGLLAPSKLYGLLGAGCPVVYVGPRHGRIPELLAREPVGVAIDNGDAAGLLRALKQLRTDVPLRTAMAARARELALSRYDRARITAAHAALLTEVAAE
jgi:glycosyltransferase involved in cell wall biosynthesis